MEGQENNHARNENRMQEAGNEGFVRKYLEIVKAFENLQSSENKKDGIDFHAIIMREADTFRIYRTHKPGANTDEKIVIDSVNDNAYGPGNECMIMYTLTKDAEGNTNAVVRDGSGDMNEKLPGIVEKLEGTIRQKGAQITFMPGKTFEFDGQAWKEVSIH